MGAATKVAIGHFHVLELVFWRSVVVSVVACALMWRGGISPRPGSWRWMLTRSILGVLAMICFFWSIGEIPLGTATTLLYTSPLFTVLLSGRVLGESRDRWTLPLVSVAFAGVILILRPVDVVVGWGEIAALFAGVLASLSYLSVRHLRTTDPPARIVGFFSMFGALVCAPFMVTKSLPDVPLDWFVLLAVGVSATLGQLAMTWAYRLEKANVIGPFSYATVVVSYFLGLIFWKEVLRWDATLGIVLVVLAGAALSRGAKASTPVETSQEASRS